MGKGTHYAMHKTIDGAHREISITMKNSRMKGSSKSCQTSTVQRPSGEGRHIIESSKQCPPHGRLNTMFRNSSKRCEDTCLHLIGRLVGECNRQYGAETAINTLLTCRQRQLQIAQHKVKRLTRTGRSLTDDKGFYGSCSGWHERAFCDANLQKKEQNLIYFVYLLLI